MNNYCRNCGEKLENDINVCPKCNAEVFKNRINVEEKKKELYEYKNKENKYVILIIALFSLSCISFVFNFLSYINPLLFLCAIITLIYAKITMNKSIKIKIIFNIIIILPILYLLYSVISIIISWFFGL
ncbi:MAG: hypothetical protein PUD59_04780 [bacterium]|nr:hypothetical protein [bacterium]